MWDADRLLTLDREKETGYAWMLRWDDADEADEVPTPGKPVFVRDAAAEAGQMSYTVTHT